LLLLQKTLHTVCSLPLPCPLRTAVKQGARKRQHTHYHYHFIHILIPVTTLIDELIELQQARLLKKARILGLRSGNEIVPAGSQRELGSNLNAEFSGIARTTVDSDTVKACMTAKVCGAHICRTRTTAQPDASRTKK
jgi:hypothetical protein